jgi:hypothetical protein
MDGTARDKVLHPMAMQFERFIGIDWSGAATRSGQRIYVAEAHRQGGRITLHSVVRARDRSAVEAYLRGGPLEHAPAWEDWPGPGPLDRRSRRVVAMDFAFGFPAAFEHPEAAADWSWRDLTSWAASVDTQNGTIETVRQAIERNPEVARQFRLHGGGSARMHLRLTDRHATNRAESVFHLIGPSQVGLGSITGIAMLDRLRDVEGLAVWPFDPPEQIDSAAAVMVEVFPRMWLDAGLRKNELPERVRQFDAWRRWGVAFRADAELAAASSGDALDAAAAAIGAARSCKTLPGPDGIPEEACRREGWIVGVQVPPR